MFHAAVDPARSSNRPIRYIGVVTYVTDISRAIESGIRGRRRRRRVSRPVGDRCELKWHRGLELCISNDFAKLSRPRNVNESTITSAAGSCDVADRAFPRPRDRKRIDRVPISKSLVRPSRSLPRFRRHLRRHCEIMSIAMQRKYRKSISDNCNN